MFFILRLLSNIYPIGILGAGGEESLNYFAFKYTLFPVTLLIIGVLLVLTQLFLSIREKKSRNFQK